MDQIQRKQSAILGAFVADAASLGFHWLYDSERIRQLGGERPEFREPCEADYENAAGYFAADGKTAGDSSHYGAQMKVALMSLHECNGDWNPFHYQSAFCQAFDRGGWFSGYIDGATSGTLQRVKQSNDELLEGALQQAGDLTDSQRSFFKKYLIKKGVLHRGEALEEAVVGMATLVYKDEGIQEKARTVVRYYDENRISRNGADDNQLPAAAKLPVVVSRFAGSNDFSARVEEAIRVTNDNQDAVTYGLYAARVLEKVLLGDGVKEALHSALETVSDEKALEKLKEALATDVSDLHGLGRKFGPACPMPSAIPVAVALLKEEPDFRTGVRQNILVSGDNAGRSIWLGTVLAAANGLGGAAGVPLDWMSQVKGLKEIMEMVGDSSLFSER